MLSELVSVYTEDGNFLGTKKRSDVDRKKDILHCVYVFIKTPDERFLLSKIPVGNDNSGVQRIYGDKMGLTVAVILRTSESVDHAVRRGLAKEVFIADPGPMHHFGRSFETFNDGVKRVVDVFLYEHIDTDVQSDPKSISSLISLTSEEINQMTRDTPEMFAPTFLVIWRKYFSQT